MTLGERDAGKRRTSKKVEKRLRSRKLLEKNTSYMEESKVEKKNVQEFVRVGEEART